MIIVHILAGNISTVVSLIFGGQNKMFLRKQTERCQGVLMSEPSESRWYDNDVH